MSFGLLGFPRRPQPDPVTAATQRWLDQEARAEQSARAALLELQVRYADLDAELRERNRAYGRASATIGALRGDLARERAAARRKASSGWYFHLSTAEPRPADEPIAAEWEQSAHDATIAAAMQRHPSGAADPADTAKVGDVMPLGWLVPVSQMCDFEECCRPRHVAGQHLTTLNRKVLRVWPNDADADLVATAERLGDEVGQRDRQAAIEGAATTILAHTWEGPSVTGKCRCGWPGRHHPRHVAEQLAAVGALGTFAPAKKVTIDDVEALARVLNAGDQRFDDLPAWDALADEGRHTYRRLAQYVLRAGYRTRGAHPGPTPRTGSFADGGKRTFADGGA